MNVPVIVIIVAAVVLLLVALFFSSYVKAKPDEAIMVSGMGKRKIIRGGAGFKIPFLQRIDRISLGTFQIDVKSNDAIPTKEFINIYVDGVANLKISSDPVLMETAFETLLSMSRQELSNQIQQILQGNIREIIGTVEIKELVQNRQGVAEAVRNNVIPDMRKLGVELLTFNIQNFSDSDDVIVNLGIDNIVQISKDAAIARAKAEKEIAIEQAAAAEASNKAKVEADTKIVEQNNGFALKKAELKVKEDTAKAEADAAYDLQSQKKKEEINIASVNAVIAQKEREVELGERQVELKEKQLRAEINKKAEAEKYAAEKKAEAELFTRQKKAEAEKFEAERKAEMQKIQAEAEKVEKERAAEALKIEAEAQAAARVAKAEAEKTAALAEAEGIEAKGKAEAEAIREKAEAMKLYGEAATLQLILDSNVIPATVEAYSKPMAEAMGQIGEITMYGSGNEAKLVEEISKNGTQIFDGLQKTLGFDVKSVLGGFLGAKILDNKKNPPAIPPVEEEKTEG